MCCRISAKVMKHPVEEETCGYFPSGLGGHGQRKFIQEELLLGKGQLVCTLEIFKSVSC